MQGSEIHRAAVISIRLAVLLFAVYATANLPDALYTAMRSRPLYEFPNQPVPWALFIWALKIGMLSAFYFLGPQLARLTIRGMETGISWPRESVKGLSGVILLVMAIFLFFEGLGELSRAMIFSSKADVEWDPLSGKFPQPFYDSISAILHFFFAFVLVFRKRWLPGTGFGKQE